MLLFIYLGLLLFCVLSIVSDIKSLNKEIPEENDFERSKEKIRRIDSLFYAIILLILLLYLIYNEI
jgi:hypothetical protein